MGFSWSSSSRSAGAGHGGNASAELFWLSLPDLVVATAVSFDLPPEASVVFFVLEVDLGCGSVTADLPVCLFPLLFESRVELLVESGAPDFSEDEVPPGNGLLPESLQPAKPIMAIKAIAHGKLGLKCPDIIKIPLAAVIILWGSRRNVHPY